MKTLRHVYTDMCMRTHSPDLCTQASCMCTHARVLETMKNKFFFALKLRFGTNLISSGSCSKPSFSQYKKPYIVTFQNTQKNLREN